MGIEGIPLNWWNIHVFKVIGAKLGVLEIAKETMDFSFLNYAKIRVIKGFSNEFLPSVLEMPQGSDTVMRGIFPLMGRRSPPSARALGPALRRGVAVRNYFDSLISMPQDVSNSAEALKGKGKQTDSITGERLGTQGEDADVEARREKLALADVKGADSLSASADKVDRDWTARVIDDGSLYFSNEGDDCYGESTKLVQLWKPTTLDAEMERTAEHLEISSDNNGITSPKIMGMGQQQLKSTGSGYQQCGSGQVRILQRAKQGLSNWGQAQIHRDKSHQLKGLGKAQKHFKSGPKL